MNLRAHSLPFVRPPWLVVFQLVDVVDKTIDLFFLLDHNFV